MTIEAVLSEFIYMDSWVQKYRKEVFFENKWTKYQKLTLLQNYLYTFATY